MILTTLRLKFKKGRWHEVVYYKCDGCGGLFSTTATWWLKQKLQHYCYSCAMQERGVPVVLQNFKTGLIIHAKSITDFCRQAKLNGNDKLHITPVLQGKRLHHKNWHLPWDGKIRVICDVYGNRYQCKNILKFAKTYKKNPNRIKALIDGKINSYHGLYLEGRNSPFVFKRKHYNFYFYKQNSVIKTKSGAAFSRILGVSPWAVYNVMHGKQDTIKDWCFIRVEELPEKNRVLFK